jgi:hypothetical protein
MKIPASHITALRWREIFQAALTGMATNPGGKNHDKATVARAADMADYGILAFYERFQAEEK